MAGNDENILVEFDYDNISVIDPNKVISADGTISERLIKHENLVIYANLEATALPRTRLAINNKGNLENERVSIASVNFMKPGNKTFLSNEYLDTMTGENKGDVGNPVPVKHGNETIFDGQADTQYIDSELLLITQISIENDLSGYPQVTIEMEDVRGRALFEKGELSPYAVFFNYPYPIFYLTVKGYFGKAIKYQLALRSFNARFNTQTGNFSITVKFLTYKFNILSELSMKYLLSLPFMYETKYTVTPTIDAGAQSSQSSAGKSSLGPVDVVNTSKGLQKLHEVYSIYKSKKLIDLDFPELTIQELMTRLQNLETYIMNTFTEADLKPLTDATNYGNILTNYEQEVFLYQSESWFAKYLDKENYYIKNDKRKIYTFKKEVREGVSYRKAAIQFLQENIIKVYNGKLNDVAGFGDAEPKNTELSVGLQIKYEDINIPEITPSEIDWEQSYKERFGKDPNANENKLNFETFKSSGETIINNSSAQDDNQTKFFWYWFEGDGSFTNKILEARKNLNTKIGIFNVKLEAKLASRLSDKQGGLGFKPLLINFVAVILASAEAFIRLLCDVHENAWDQRNSEIRRTAILDDSKTQKSPDAKDSVQKDGSNLIPIYPWPHYFVQSGLNDTEPFVLAYPGDPKVQAQTKGYRYDIWPEVEFVEEFIKARVLNSQASSKLGTLKNSAQVTDRVSINALDFPTSDIIYQDKQAVKFLYEIWERVYLYSNYQRLMRPGAENEISGLIAETEMINIKGSVGEDSPDLIKLLKNISFNSKNFENVMKNISNGGVGESWQKYVRDIFVTNSIQQSVDVSFSILDGSIIQPGFNVVTTEPKEMDKLRDYLKGTKSNNTNLTDTFPFTGSTDWCQSNLGNGISSSNSGGVYNTTKVLSVNNEKKMIANFSASTASTEIRPITNFSYLKYSEPNPTQNNLKAFYLDRINNNITKQLPTEGTLRMDNYTNSLLSVQTTSMLNTPYFVNAIQKGVNNWVTGATNPYKEAAFLFLNSLPLSTLREKYKSYNGTDSGIELDYIFATLKKFGAIHKIPYVWILKYGSIWHRYKTFINSGVDILSDIWTNFDPVYNFDPITNNINKEYNLTANSINQRIRLEKNTPSVNSSVYEMNVGFYPKVINDFNLFYRGYNIFDTYTNSEIQSKIDNTSGFTLTFNDDSSFNKSKGYNPNLPNEYLDFRTWSCTLLDNTKQYVVPSFGSNINQTLSECFDNQDNLVTPVVNNQSVFNGSVRTFWSLPNYGYFDDNTITIPSPLEYMKQIISGDTQQESFSLNYENYTNIEEMFSVFDKEVLDILENEFLKFSKSMYDVKIDENTLNQITKVVTQNLPSGDDIKYQNFQLLMKNMMSTNKVVTNNSTQFNSSVQQNQLKSIMTYVQKLLEYDVVVRYGNPSGFDRRVFGSFSTIEKPEDPITYNAYVVGSLPSPSNTTLSLSSYFNNNPKAWATLKTYVGFYTEDGISYNSTGCTVTDFFIDNNVEFNEDNARIFAPLIKIYATQKKIDPTYNATKFRQSINQYLLDNNKFSDLVFDSLFTKLKKELPNITEQPKKDTSTSLQGEQTKLELYDSFKALNDTWIAGYDFKQTTFMEDVLLLDRASRNIRDKILLDPFLTRNLFPGSGVLGINENSAVYGYVSSVIQGHNFNVMMMSSWINFYNVQTHDQENNPKPEGTSDFGNSMFGTHMNVDARESSPKIVCTYNSLGSEHVDTTKNSDNRFGDDSFKLERRGNPLTTSYDDKTKWSQVNKVVGFNVDIGIRNQNMFYYFDVSQDVGKETYDSLLQTDNQINQANGKKGSTQSTSLWSFYKKRSYECQVRSMGNMMIQPTMYFNVRYVPMFYGPYYITSVKHNITPGMFETTFKGTRQSAFSFPNISEANYLQLVTTKLLEEIREKLAQNQQTSKAKLTNSADTSTLSSEFGDIDISINCQPLLPKLYEKFIPVSQVADNSSAQEVADNIKKYVVGTNNDLVARRISFVTCYLASWSDTIFTYYNNNICGAILYLENTENVKKAYGDADSRFLQKTFLCRKDIFRGYVSQPTACFNTKEDMYGFLNARWRSTIVGNTVATTEDYLRLWYTRWNRSLNVNDFNAFKVNYPEQYENYYKKVEAALVFATNLHLS